MTIAAVHPTHSTLASRVIPRGAIASIALVVSGVAVVGLLAQVTIPLPYSPVPITGQTLGVMLIAAAYGANLGAITLAAYALVGVIGVPVFADFSGGLHTVTSPTFGYVLGFIAAAYLIGWLSERGWDRAPRRSLVAFGLASAVPFIIGVPYLAVALTASGVPTDISQAIQLGFVPFIIPGIVKWVVAAAALPAAHRIVTAVQRHS